MLIEDSNFIPTCSECSTAYPPPGISAVRGDSAMAICRECHHRMCMHSCHRDVADSVLTTLLAVRIQEVKQTVSRFKHATADMILLFLVRASRAPGQKKVRIIVSGFAIRRLDPDALSCAFLQGLGMTSILLEYREIWRASELTLKPSTRNGRTWESPPEPNSQAKAVAHTTRNLIGTFYVIVSVVRY